MSSSAPLRELIDDPVLNDEVLLYRRVNWDQIGGKARFEPGSTPPISGNCFTDQPMDRAAHFGFAGPCMSVGVDYLIQKEGMAPRDLLDGRFLNGRDPGEFGLVSVRIGDIRSLEKGDKSSRPQGIMIAPTPAEPWHGVVFDLVEGERTKPTRRALAKLACWVIPLTA